MARKHRAVARSTGHRRERAIRRSHSTNRRVTRQQAPRGVHDRVVDRLHVRLRSADDAKDVGSGRLPGERFLRLVEQARVLDGDHRLVGERLRERDLRVVEAPIAARRIADAADGAAVAQQGHEQRGLVAQRQREVAHARELLRASSVSATLMTRESRCRSPAPLPRSSGQGSRNPPWRSLPSLAKATDSIMLVLRHRKGDSATGEQPLAAVHDGVEYRLRVGDRAADHAQDLGSRRLPLERLLRLVEQSRVLDRDQRLVGGRIRPAQSRLAIEPSGLVAKEASRPRSLRRRAAAARRATSGRPAAGEP